MPGCKLLAERMVCPFAESEFRTTNKKESMVADV